MAKDHGDSERKLDALQRSYDVDERRALEEKRRIDLIVEERAKIVDELEKQQHDIEERLKDLRGNARRAALQLGDAAQLAAAERYVKRLQSQASALASQLEARRQELQQARDRSEGMEQEILEVRIEKKKVERILQSRAQVARVVKEATEEALSDEMNFFRGKK